MREFEAILQDVTLTGLAFAIAIGWSLYQVGYGVASLVAGLTTHLSAADGAFQGGGMTWVVGHHILTLDALVSGLVELGVALGVAAVVRSRYAAGRPPRAVRRHPS